MKTCNKCGMLKPDAEYSVRRESRDGRQYSCKACNAQYRTDNADHYADWRKENRTAFRKTPETPAEPSMGHASASSSPWVTVAGVAFGLAAIATSALINWKNSRK